MLLHARRTHIPEIDGVIIEHSPQSTGTYLGSPSICILHNGDYLISHDEFGKGQKRFGGNPVYRSNDKGQTWELLSVVTPGVKWGKIFTLEKIVYMIGPSRYGTGIVLFKSEDNGRTWEESDKIFAEKKFHTAPTPVILHDGRIWKGFEIIDSSLPKQWPKQYCAAILSASVNSDLTDEKNWLLSECLRPDFSWLDGKFGGWLEGNAVYDRKGNMKILMRVELPEGYETEYTAEINVLNDGGNLDFDPDSGFHLLPGGAKKFTVRYDRKSGRYWTLSNEIVSMRSDKFPGEIRNTLSLVSSKNLKEWIVHKRVISTNDIDYTGFQYVDWQIDGDDIVFVSRTSYYDDSGGAHNHHDSNYITFHRIKGFRTYKSLVLQ